jgi:hypothetical protein
MSDNDQTRFDKERRRDLRRFLRKMDGLAAQIELRQQYHPLSPQCQQTLAYLDRTMAQVRDMLTGKLPLDTVIPTEE